MKRVFLLLLYLITGCGGGAAVSPGGRDNTVPAPETVRSAPLSPDIRVHVSLDPSTRPPLVLAVGEMGQIDERYIYRYTKAVEIEVASREVTTPVEGRLDLGLLLLIDAVRVERTRVEVDLLLEWTAMPGKPLYRCCRRTEGPPLYIEFPVTHTSVFSATVTLEEDGRSGEIDLPSPAPGSSETARVVLSLGKPVVRGRSLSLTLRDEDGERKHFGIPRSAASSFAAGWESTRTFLSDFDVEVGQSVLWLHTEVGSVSEGFTLVYREGYGGRWRKDLPVTLWQFHTDLGCLLEPETITLPDEQEVRRGTVRISGDSVFLDPGAAPK